MQKIRKQINSISYGVLSVIISFLLLMLMTGCSDSDDITQDAEVVPPEIEQEIEQENEQEIYLDYFTMVSVTADNIFRFVTLGNYKGIEFNSIMPEEVTETDIDEFIAEHLMVGAAAHEITDRAVLHGDHVLISYEGFIDGDLFQGGSDEDTFLEIGSETFIPGFEEQIIGRYAGEHFEIDVVFPDDYRVRELAGREAVFAVSLHSIHIVVPQELTDDFVRDVLGLDSVQHYRDTIRERLEQNRLEQARDEERRQVWTTVVGNATIHSLPILELDDAVIRNLAPFQDVAEDFDTELEVFILQAFGIEFEDFLYEYIKPGAIFNVTADLVLRAVAAAEGITVTAEEIEERIYDLVEEFDLENKEELLDMHDESRIKIALLSERVIEILMLHAVRN